MNSLKSKTFLFLFTYLYDNRIADQLKKDQEAVLNPDLSSFKSLDDVIDRLLPYHIFQNPLIDAETAAREGSIPESQGSSCYF